MIEQADKSFMVTNKAMELVNPKPKSRMIIVDENILAIETLKDRPNCFWRFWQWLLLGIKWEKI